MTEIADKNKATGSDVTIVTLTIDSQSATVPKGTTVLEAARGLGIHIPTFCWHAKLKSVGACRMCYVEIEKMGKLQVSCATEAMDGMIVYSDSDKVKQGRKAIIEFILANHPLDCPTCDKGGECDLQDLTFRHGVDDSRFDFRKYRFVDDDMTTTLDDRQIGPEIVLNRNRCILCYKCVRANKEVFGEYDLGVFERGNITQIMAAPGQQVDNPFSGNLVEICPVGALTSSDWRYKIRVWLTQTVPSICNFHSSGSNTLFYKENHRQTVFRTTSRPNDSIDDGWLTDVSRYGYQIIHSADRLKTPLIKKEGKQVPASWDEAIDLIAQRFGEIGEKMGRVCIGGLAAPWLDNAALHGFSKFFRTVLKSNNIDFRCDYRMLPAKAGSPFSVLCSQPFRIADIDDSDVILVFGSDLLREHPNEFLRVRKAATESAARVFVANPYGTKTGDVAELELTYTPGKDECLINGLCLAALEEGLADLAMGGAFHQKVKVGSVVEAADECGVEPQQLKAMAGALAGGRKVTVIIGELITRSRGREAVAAAIANLNRLLNIESRGQIAVLARYANSIGAQRLGLSPSPPENVIATMQKMWGQFPDAEPKTTDAMLVQAKKEEISGFFIMGTNPLMLYPDLEFVREALERLDFLVVADLFETEATALADVVLPLSSWAEQDGEYLNLEGTIQRSEAAIKPLHQYRPGLEIVSNVAEKMGQKLFDSADECGSEIESLLKPDNTVPWPNEFLEVKPVEDEAVEEYPYPIYLCDDPHHSDYRTEKSTSLANFVAEPYIEISAALAGEFNLEEGNSVRVESPYGKIIVPVRISEYIKNNVLLVPRNFSSLQVNSLFMRKLRVDRVKLSRVDE